MSFKFVGESNENISKLFVKYITNDLNFMLDQLGETFIGTKEEYLNMIEHTENQYKETIDYQNIIKESEDILRG